MDPAEFYYVGKIVKRHGTQGSLVALLEVDDANDYKDLESVYVDIAHERVPFFIESVEVVDRKKVLLKFQDVAGPDHADAFAGLELYLPLSALPKLEGNRFYYHEIKGFRVIDEEAGELGTVRDVLELPQQALFQIMHQGKEILIPVVDQVIRRVDREHRILYIRAPEGLIDLYIS